MVDLEALRKEVTHFPQGVSWSVLAEKFGVSKTTIYEDLNSLKQKEQVYNQDGLWFSSDKKKPSRFGLFDYLKYQSEIKKKEEERLDKEWLAHSWSYMELLAKSNPDEFGIMKDIVETEKKQRKELGLDK